MDNFREGIEKNFKAAGKSFYRFPAAILSALVVSIATIIKITMDFETGGSSDFLFTSIQVSFLLATASSMAFEVFAEVRSTRGRKSFLLANIPGLTIGIISFLLLYFLGGLDAGEGRIYLSSIAIARVSVGVFISIVAFIYIISISKTITSFSEAFFISHRAFIIAAIYGLIIMIGVSGVLGAFQALVYGNMSYKIYQYLGVIVGFLTYTIFLGYFPRFKEENQDEIEAIGSQPRFIFILFEYILIPIMISLTFVLLVWSVRVVLKGIDISFNQLSGIASSYVIVGIWLHIMVGSHQTKLANFYKRAYPFAGVLILIFEAWALWDRISKFGLQTAEYSFLMIWIFAVISILLLIFLKEKGYRKIAITAAVILTITVLPIIGYQDLTFNSQVKRLEKMLIAQDILVDGRIVSGGKDIDLTTKGEITDAVDFISYSEKTDTPAWFKEDLDDEKVFKVTFGFEKTYGVHQDPEEYNYLNFSLENDIVDVSDYSMSLNTISYGNNGLINEFEGKEGYYEIIITDGFENVPEIEVKLEGKTIHEESMEGYLSGLMERYSTEGSREVELGIEDMSLAIEADDLSILLVINHIDIYLEGIEDETTYYIEYRGIYAEEK